MNATLKGPNGQIPLESTPNPYSIGRAPDNQLVVDDAMTSSYHAQIRPGGQGYEIIDLASSNGTFVNEQLLAPNTPRLLASNDRIRIGNTTCVFEAGLASTQSDMEATVYGGGNQESSPANPAYAAYSPTVAAQPPAYSSESYNAPQGAYAPPPYGTNGYSAQPADVGANVPVQQKKPGRGKIWIIVGAIVALIAIAVIVFSVIGFANNSTTTKQINAQKPHSTSTLTLNNYCNALAQQNYQTAYNQLSSSAQSQETEAQFAASFSPLTVSKCIVSNVNDSAGTGIIIYTLSNGNSGPLDYTLINENGTWKIDSEKQPA